MTDTPEPLVWKGEPLGSLLNSGALPDRSRHTDGRGFFFPSGDPSPGSVAGQPAQPQSHTSAAGPTAVAGLATVPTDLLSSQGYQVGRDTIVLILPRDWADYELARMLERAP